MDDSVKDGSQATVGNTAIPDWLLKRRARLQAQAAKNQITSPIEPAQSTPLEAEPPPVATPDEPAEDSVQAPGVIEADEAAPVASATVPAVVAAVEESSAELPDPSIKTDSPPLLIALPADVSTEMSASAVPKKIVLPVVKAEAPVLLEWQEVLRRRWFGKDALGSYAISIGMHVIVALLLSLVVFHEEIANLGINTLFAEQSENLQSDALDDSAVFQIDTSGGQTGEELNAMLSANAVSSALGPSALQAPEIAGATIGEGEGEGNKVGDGLSLGGFQMPEGGKGVVKKGSFAAWTVPDDPAPGEDYKIIIQVRYKGRNQKMPTGDISGSVIGTDKYRLMISPHTSEVIPEANQVVVHIPGAAARVRDTIRVYSAILRENQRLEIVF